LKHPKEIFLDKKGYDEFLNRITKLEVELQQLRRSKADALKEGDNWHDNFAYEQLTRDEQSLMEEINKLTVMLERIVVIETKSGGIDNVSIGSKVKIKLTYDTDETEEMTIRITGGFSDELDEVSINSPLGEAIYLKKEKEQIKYEVNGKKILVKILKIYNDK
jgi:transcription elongation GreA/GreB family factor